MIASISGEVLVRRPDHVVVEVGGVGYQLSVSAATLRAVPAVGNRISLFSQLIARDDGLTLYGFATEEERGLFGLLTSVSGVGPKVALAVLSGGHARELLGAIASGDAKRFQAVPGIGKRTAERIIVELREKVAGEIEGDADGAEISIRGPEDPRSLAREGLLNLGYSPQEAERLLDGAQGDSPEELIQAALRRGAGAKAA